MSGKRKRIDELKDNLAHTQSEYRYVVSQVDKLKQEITKLKAEIRERDKNCPYWGERRGEWKNRQEELINTNT